MYFPPANSDELNFKKLFAGRIDVFPAGEVVGWRVASELDPQAKQKIAVLKKPLAKQYGHLLFAKENPRSATLVAKFNQALQEMKQDGTLRKYHSDMLNGVY